MTVSLVVPYRAGDPWREAAWEWVQVRYPPEWEQVLGQCAPGPFNRSEAILEGASRASGDVLVVADADVWCDATVDAVAQVQDGKAWAVPHRRIYRLSKESTTRVLFGAPWHGLPLSEDNRQDRRPYIGNAGGTLLVLSRAALEKAPPDPRFMGWGQEDEAWGCALRTLVGPVRRGVADLVHLWHPAQPRLDRRKGNPENVQLWQRYRRAEGSRPRMAALVDEGRVAHGARGT